MFHGAGLRIIDSTARIKVEGVDKPTLFGEIVQAITAMDGVLVGVDAL